ncbi:hypothetical protein COLO4_24035 [Corchorus olitorius]|uniref:Uncharacterized protein n=1 Tax=Corchorus olitorius TaxID=93759 RepID=A0A1R3ID93_9ROSI|nr:hypothetical protein COLO4_24035 [Corchorus olitorius]
MSVRASYAPFPPSASNTEFHFTPLLLPPSVQPTRHPIHLNPT